MAMNSLTSLAADLLSGRVRVVDLTQTLSPEFPQIVLPPESANAGHSGSRKSRATTSAARLVLEQLLLRRAHRYALRCADPLGVGPRPAEQCNGHLAVQHLVGAACVIDCSQEAAADADFLLTAAHRRWEEAHGRIPARSWVLMRTDWSKRYDPVAYQNYDETGQHTPGPATDAVRFLVDERDVIGFGSEAIGTDAGQGYHLKPPYPCHYYMHGAGRYGLQCLANLDLSASADRCGDFLRTPQDQKRLGQSDSCTRAGIERRRRTWLSVPSPRKSASCA